MSPGRIRARGEEIRKFILDHVEASPADIARLTAEKFGISRQGANKHLDKLISQGTLMQAGVGRQRVYALQPLIEWWGSYELADSPTEDAVWRSDIAILLETLPTNVTDIWHYAFTEMFNNAIDHSEGTHISVYVERTPKATEIVVRDDGIGIFKKIQQSLGLDEESHAILELAKGKFTTDPQRHTGEGIFFTSRMMDFFSIRSGRIYFAHKFGKREDWVLADAEALKQGTAVSMELSNHTARTERKIFDEFSSDDGDYGFTKTIIPVELAQYGDDKLVSRSQAKRMLARVDRFKTVMLDFEGVKTIGQAFADEAFRVFAAEHPNIELLAINAAEPVQQMISRAEAALAEQFQPLKFVRVITEDVGVPRNDNTPGSALYEIPIELSAAAPREWAKLFVDAFDHPPQWTSMHRPGIASVRGNRVILDGTTMEELEKVHNQTLALALDQANREYVGLLARQGAAEKTQQEKEEHHRSAVEEAAKKIKFN